MVPALLGSLTFQLMEGERLVSLNKAKVSEEEREREQMTLTYYNLQEYFTEYLQRCYDYAITAEVRDKDKERRKT